MDAYTFLPPKPPRQRQAVRWHVGNKAIVSIRGIDCTCIENSKKGYVFARVDNPKITFPLTVAEFDELKELQSFRYEKEGMDAERSHAILHSPVRSLSDLPKEDRHYVQWKVKACQIFLRMEQGGLATRYGPRLVEALAAIQMELDKESGLAIRGSKHRRGGRQPKTGYTLVGPKRFLEWVNLFVKEGPLGLCDHYHACGNHASRYTPDEYAKLFEYVTKYLSPERPTIARLHRDMGTEIADLNIERRRNSLPDLRVPDDDLLRREIRKLPAFDVMAARYSVSEAINFFRAVTGGVPDLARPMQRVEADEWKTHLHTLAIELGLWEPLSPQLKEKAEKTRVWVGAAMCCTTRCIVGLTVAPEAGSQSTRMLLRMMLTDKSSIAQAVGCQTPWEYRGSGDTFAVDEGTSNVNWDTEFICTDLGIGLKVPQAEMPTQRGKIERFLQTLDIRSIARFSGRTFSNPVVRAKYDSLARACVTVDELCALIVRFIVDEYHNTEHAGLGGEMPRACWLRVTKVCPPTVPPGRDKIRTVFGEDMSATLGPSGICVFGNWYWSPSLHKIFETVGNVELAIRVDTEDLGAISVRRPGGWLTVIGPDVMDKVCLKVWGDAQDDMRRQNADFAAMAKPVAQRAIAYAMKGDEETRKRLLIQYRPMTGDDFERARKKMWIGVRYTDEGDRAPQTQPDLFAGALPTGQAAPQAAVATSAIPAEDPKPRPKAKRKTASLPSTNEPAAPHAPEKTRKWTFRGR